MIDCVASKKAGAFSSLLKYNGQMVSISESLSEIPVIAAMRGLTIHEIALSGVYAHGLKEHVEEMIDNCHSLLTELASGKIQANIGSTLSFEQLKDGLQQLQLGQCYGKIIVNVN
ncbi:hypothetical protein CS022_08275 [Veronia nyctiphanis]|uniref:Uncharacterized protein n=1 Tax=Veronia nyctiphanis TaxID=1278244 RepID=A0A4Q0YWV0_9GAMM|nr:zinc-binding dehydrogenase [Veronia nyctiphanis]RXJ73719.1 hypothetical protein CS022_08275 [Veronia nyctiphanis]